MGTHINPELPTEAYDSHRERADEWSMTWSRYLAALAGYLDATGGPPDDVLLAAMRAADDAAAVEAAREAVGGGAGEPATDGGPAAADGEPEPAPDGGAAATTAGPAWPDGLAPDETEVVEHLVGRLRDRETPASPSQLDQMIPLEHVQIEIDDVAGALAAHPDVEQSARGWTCGGGGRGD